MHSKAIAILSGALLNASAEAQVGLSLPSTPSSYNHDEIRTSSGLSCRQAGGSATNFEVGIVATDEETTRYDSSIGALDQKSAVYARITHAFGAPKRIDCYRVYELELERLQAEIELLRMEQMYSMPED